MGNYMKLNNEGFAISSIMYIILVFSLVLVVSILGLLSSRKMTLDKVKKTTLNEVKSNLNRKIYHVGDIVMIKGEEYRVIVNSPKRQDYVTLLKTNPLTVDEVNANKIGSDEINHVNKYTSRSSGEAYDPDQNGYGGIAYYSSETCGYNPPNQGEISDNSGCTASYDSSDIKYVIDNWATSTFTNNELKNVALQGYGTYKARLVTNEELKPVGWPSYSITATSCSLDQNTPNWIYSNYYWYWTMSQVNDSSPYVMFVGRGGFLSLTQVYNEKGTIRPVINVYKTIIEE